MIIGAALPHWQGSSFAVPGREKNVPENLKQTKKGEIVRLNNCTISPLKIAKKTVCILHAVLTFYS